MDRHHEPDRAARRLRPRRAQVARPRSRRDGTYRIFGTKIFITYGDHEMTDNIIHLVLARLPDAPPGTRGISLFLVPKYLVNKDGSLGARNDVICAGVEHKLGIHASPTCVMKYGEKDGAVGYLVGEENRGLNVMFIMMNAARLAVGTQGVAVAERATQQARRLRQGAPAGPHRVEPRARDMAPIIEHADIRRTLMTMKALTQAARAICLVTAQGDRRLAPRQGRGRCARPRRNRVALLTPIAKAFSTDIGCEVASIGVQVHGGMGFIEETGAAQIYRDARILPIYEGTNGIQAIDLVTRKLPLEGGKVVDGYIGELQADGRGGARLQPPRVRPHGRAPRRGGGGAGRGHALDGRRACRRTPRPRWPAPRRTCACSASPSGGIYLARGRAGGGPRRRNGRPAAADRDRPLLRREHRHAPRPASRTPSSAAPTPR